MKKVENLQRKEVVHVASKKEAEAFCDLLTRAGMRWLNGRPFNEEVEFESSYLSEGGTCYHVAERTFSSREYFKRQGGVIFYEAKDFLADDAKKRAASTVTKTREMLVNGLQREVTVAVLIDGKKVRGGYSVLMAEDKTEEKYEEGRDKTIAIGRANKDKTNLLDMEIGKGMDKKYILEAIADDLLTRIEKGIIKIKGVKPKQ